MPFDSQTIATTPMNLEHDVRPAPAPVVLTIGIPAYNAAASIEAAVLSILRQTWRGSMEILIVDDGSTDRTVQVANRLAQQYGAVRVVQHGENLGRPAARNTILRESRGEYMTWADADDEWYPNKLAVQFDELLASAEAQAGGPVICMSSFDWRWAHSGKLQHRVPDVTSDPLKAFLSGRVGAYLWTMLARTQTFRDVGEFDAQLPRLQDLDFLIRFAARGGRIIVSNPARPLCVYHKNDDDKPGRVIAQSLSHIWRKHYPLYRQYGRGFCRGARRKHLLLASRHAFSNEGRLLGTAYYLRAALASPGWLLGPLKARLRGIPPRPPSKVPRTDRLEAEGFEPVVRSAAAIVSVDVVVSLSAQHDEALGRHFGDWSDITRSRGMLYVPRTIGLPKGATDHAALLDLLDAGDDASKRAARRLLEAAVLSSTDGASSVLYLGAPVELDRHSVATVRSGVERCVRLLGRLAATLAGQPRPVRVRLHLLVPDTETLLWRRYLMAIQNGREINLERWVQALSPSDAALLDHRAIAPLCSVDGYESTRVHLLGDGSLLSSFSGSLATLCGVDSAALPPAPLQPLAAPARNHGLVAAEGVLAAHVVTLGPQAVVQIRQGLWKVLPSRHPRAAPAALAAALSTHCVLDSPAQRFAPAKVVHHASPGAAARCAAHELVYPQVQPEDFEQLARDLHLLASAMQLGRNEVEPPAPTQAR